MSFKIFVCVKQVLDIDKIRIDKKNGELITEKANKVTNGDDLNALEEALRIKDTYPDTHITVITMGAPEAKNMLLECLALGADDAVLISDTALEESDTLVTAEILSRAIKKIGEFDVVLTGQQAIGGDTAQVGPQIAEKLKLPQIVGIASLKIENSKVITAKKVMEDNYVTLRTKMPCLLSAMRELNKPRSMTLRGILEARKKEIKIWNKNDLEFSADFTGLDASATRVTKTSVPFHNKKCKFIKNETELESVQSLIKELHCRFIV